MSHLDDIQVGDVLTVTASGRYNGSIKYLSNTTTYEFNSLKNTTYTLDQATIDCLKKTGIGFRGQSGVKITSLDVTHTGLDWETGDDASIEIADGNNGLATVTGTYGEAAKTTFSNSNYTAYDLTGVTFPAPGNILSSTNPNALFIVTSAQAANIDTFAVRTKNVVVKNDNGSYTSGRITLTDDHDLYTGISVTADSITYSRPSISGTYATTCLPFAAALPEGVTAYEFSSLTDNSVVMEPAERLEANTPYVINGAMSLNLKAADATFHPTASGDTFVGNYATITATGSEGYYVLASDNTGLTFRLSSGTIGAFRGYLKTNNAGAKLSLLLDNSTTGINNISRNTKSADEGYDLMGRRVGKSYHGIVIVNGKKYIKK